MKDLRLEMKASRSMIRTFESGENERHRYYAVEFVDGFVGDNE